MNVTSTTPTQYTQATNKTVATKATSAYESVATSPTQQTDKMKEMKEKYKDVYTPIPETYSKADEDLQMKKIHEAYPKYMTLTQVFAKSNSFYEGEPIILGKTPTAEQEKQQKIASEKMHDWIVQEYGSQEGFNGMVQGAQGIINKYPANDWAKANVPNAKELARFQNATIYEGLESGKTLEEAKKYAGSIRDKYMDFSATPSDTHLYPWLTDSNAKEPTPDTVEPNFNSPMNTIWDLRQYGIEGDWAKNSIYNNDTAMIAELEKKTGEFNFMLNNENFMKEANSKLDPSEQNLAQANHYKEYINNEYLPETKFALDIFKNYKIYDSVNVKA